MPLLPAVTAHYPPAYSFGVPVMKHYETRIDDKNNATRDDILELIGALHSVLEDTTGTFDQNAQITGSWYSVSSFGKKELVCKKHVVVDVHPAWHWENIIFKAMTDIAAELGVELEIRRHGDLPG
jgi:hypothetical protein